MSYIIKNNSRFSVIGGELDGDNTKAIEPRMNDPNANPTTKRNSVFSDNFFIISLIRFIPQNS